MKRTLSLAALALATGAALVVPAAPAAATTAEPITMKVGQTLLVKRPAITGVSTVFQANTRQVLGVGALVNAATPADCAGESFGCEVIPISWPVPDEDDPDRIEAAGYLLEVTMSWDSGQSVENLPEVGTIRQNRLEGYLYQSPPIRNANGTPNYTALSAGANPAALVAVNPTSNKFDLVIANMHGVNNGYTLQISLADAKSIEFDPSDFKPNVPKTPDYVQPQIPEGATPQDSGFGGAVAPPPSLTPSGPTVGGPAVAKPIVVPNIANGRADGQLLAMSKLTITTGLGKTGAVNVSSKTADTVIKERSGLAVALGLLALPVLALLSGFFLMARSRKDKRTDVVTA
jgi:hypothetical protein